MSATDASRRTRVFKGQIEAVSHQWVRQFAHLDADRRRTHRCIETLLDMEDPDAHKAALAGLYGYEILNRAIGQIDGDLRFFGLQPPSPNLEGWTMHQCLLKQYAKAQPRAVDT